MLENMPLLLLVVLALPVVAAVVVAALGPRNRDAVRWVSLAAVLLNVLLTGVLAVRAAPILAARNSESTNILLKPNQITTFEPIWVPGDPGGTHRTTWSLLEIPLGTSSDTAAVQFYVGIDGL